MIGLSRQQSEMTTLEHNGVTSNNYKWIEANNGKMPPGAVVGGYNHLGAIYIGRVNHQGSWIPGKIIPKYGRCYITSQELEIYSKNYQVLCRGALSWETTTSESQIPNTAVQGGKDNTTNTTFFIGRVTHGNSVTVGKVDGTSCKCYILYGKAEHGYDNYELLVSDSSDSSNNLVTRVPAVLAPSPTVSKPLKSGNAGEDFKLESLPPTDNDYIHVLQKMKESIPNVQLVKVERVWNKTQWKRTMHCKEKILEENNNDANEKELFHGSPHCNEIVKKGFDERFAKNGSYGAGLYFSHMASISNSYSPAASSGRHRQMLLCRVLLGKSSNTVSSINGSAHAPPGCHSVANQYFVVYRGEQALPKFLISYN